MIAGVFLASACASEPRSFKDLLKQVGNVAGQRTAPPSSPATWKRMAERP